MQKFLLSLVLLLFGVSAAGSLHGQTLKRRPATPSPAPTAAQPSKPTIIPLTVTPGTPLKVALDTEVKIQKPGQVLHGKTTEPIYAFDKLLVPAGSEVTGRIEVIDPVSTKKRVLAAMDADFSPSRKIQVELVELVAPGGRRLAIHTIVSPGTNGVLQFVAAKDSEQSKVAAGKALAKGKLAQAKQQVREQLAAFKTQITAPNKAHRLERYALAQSPYRPQYLDPGTSFSATVPAYSIALYVIP